MKHWIVVASLLVSSVAFAGELENANHQTIGYFAGNDLENANHQTIGYASGVSHTQAAAFLFCFFKEHH